MRRSLIYIIILNMVFGYAIANTNEVYFMTSANIDFEQDGYNIGYITSDKNVYNVYVASSVDDKMKIRPSDKQELFKDYMDFGVHNVLFYVHGYGKEIEEVYQRALLMQDEYDVKVVFFFWPYKTEKGKPSTLFQSHDKIENSLPVFDAYVGLANELRQRNMHMNISMMAHSLGNYFLKLYAQEESAQEESVFDNLILNSAAVNDRKHGLWLSKLAIQKRTYVLFNNHDFLLKGLQLFTRAKRQLGNKTNRFKIPTVNYIDLSETIGFRLPVRDTHSFFTGEILNELKPVKHMYSVILTGREFDKQDYVALEMKME